MAGALEALDAAVSALEALSVRLSKSCLEPGSVPRAAAALGRLAGLRRLRVDWSVEGPPDAEGLLAAALPSLPALSSLEVRCCPGPLTLPPQLALAPEALRELVLTHGLATWSHAALAAAPQLGGVTRLDICGDHHGMVPLVFIKLPALCQLELRGAYLDTGAASLPHLTRLYLDECCAPAGANAPRLSLAAAAPRLEALRWCGGFGADDGAAAAAAGHPCLRELRIECIQRAARDMPNGAWLHTPRKLPGVSRLALFVEGTHDFRRGSDDEEDEGYVMGTLEQLPSITAWLCKWEGLQHLELRYGGRALHELLAAVGAAVGFRLRSLTLIDAQVPASRADVERAAAALGASYPRLEALTLQLRAPWCWPEAEAHALMQAVPAAAPLCPALREVRLGPSSGSTAFRKAVWLRPAGM